MEKETKIQRYSIVLLVISTILLVYACKKYYITSFDMGIAATFGKMLGYSLWFWFFGFLAWKFIFKKKKNYGLLSFSVLFFITSAYQASKLLNNRYADVATVKEIINVAEEQWSDSKSIKNNRVYDKETYGENSIVLSLMKELIEKERELQNEAAKVSLNIDIENILAPETLNNQSDIKASIGKLKDYSIYLDNYRNRYLGLGNDLGEKVSKSTELSDSYKRSFLKSFNQSKDKNQKLAIQYIDAEKDSIAEIIGLLSFLLEKKNHYKFEDKQIRFILQEDVDTYNNYIARIQSLGKRQEEIKEEFSTKQQSYIREAKKIH